MSPVVFEITVVFGVFLLFSFLCLTVASVLYEYFSCLIVSYCLDVSMYRTDAIDTFGCLPSFVVG